MDRLFRLQNLKVHLGERFTLAIPALGLDPGRIYVFTGSNGAGKSTLLKVLSFLLLPTSGELWFLGEKATSDPKTRNRLRRKVTLVEQSPYLFSGTVYHNLAFGLRIRGVRGAEQHRRIASTLEMVGMDHFIKCNVSELSGGEAQRVTLARALALKPEVLILDEPASNIDRQSLERIEEVLRQLPKEGVTVIMSTHDTQQPQRVGGQVIMIKEGRLESGLPSGGEKHVKDATYFPPELSSTTA